LKIGIPRALLYSIYFPLWKVFFMELGHEVILSNHTNQEILNNGVKICVDDACLPIKIFHGHVTDLIGRVDAILIPRLISIRPEEYICPKFIGLPEMIRYSVPGSPELLVMDYNAYSSEEKGYEGMYRLGRELGSPHSSVKHALNKARLRQAAYFREMEKGFHPMEIMNRMNHPSERYNPWYKDSFCTNAGLPSKMSAKNSKGTIGLIGHPYLLYDRYINMNICNKLAARGYKIRFPENSTQEKVDGACSRYPKKLFWSYGKRLLGAGLSMMESREISGLILLTSFGCGIDAFIDELLIRANHREFGIPLTTITLDEHTGQAGFDTRLEAFIDMMEWRSRYDNHISPHGAHLYSGQGPV
jgi:predicted nucleotide-binding protein (sugar kinase/HSP70/actin superfamily)